MASGTSETASVEVEGYAWAGGGRRIIRVDVSVDGGETWMPAKLKQGSEQPSGRAWAWVLWEANLELPKSVIERAHKDKQATIELCCKAVDESFNTQPSDPAPIW